MAVGRVDKKARLIRSQDRRRNRIPGGITPEHFLAITQILRDVLQDIDNELRALQASCGSVYQDDERPKELHIRLNESDKSFPLPIFAGWVESEDMQQMRQDWNHPDPGLHRFGDDVYSEIYGEAFRYANDSTNQGQNHFRYRDWQAGEILEKRSGEKATDPKAGNRFQTCLAIVIDDFVNGTLVVGFRQRPADPMFERTKEILGEWAREPKSPHRNSLIDYLRSNFELGGPHLRDSDWVKLLP
jgi:hypothetical protein